jgi:cGMP-dependent protein kinase
MPLPEQTLTHRLEAANALQVILALSWDTRSLLVRALSNHPLFHILPQADVFHLISRLKYYEIGSNELMYEQGFPPTSFYILRDGKALVSSNGVEIRTLGGGASLGHQDLFHGNPRCHTVITLECATYFSLDMEDFSFFLKTAQERNFEELRNFNYTLKQLEGLPSHYIDALSRFAALERYHPGETIVSEGESGALLYFIQRGDAVVTVQDQEIRRLHPGECFGEQALLYDGIRTATVTAVSELYVEAVPKQVLYRLFGPNLDNFIYTNTGRIALDKCPAFHKLSTSDKEKLIECMFIVTFGYDEVVIAAGTEHAAALVVVLNGALRRRKGMIQRESEAVAVVYDCLCAEEVMAGTAESCFREDIVSDTDEVAVGIVTREDFLACLSSSPSLRPLSTRQFKGIPLLESLPREKQLAVVKMLTVRQYPDKAVICQQGEPGTSLFILKSGVVTVTRNGQPWRTLTKADYFGEKALLLDQPRTASVYAEGTCQVWELDKEGFLEVFDKATQEEMRTRLERADVTLSLEDLVPVQSLGHGQFGCVLLVAARDSRELYAIKAIDRRKVCSSSQAKYVMMERNILMQISHKFIMKLVKTFKDECYLYFLLEFIPGATLFTVLHDSGNFTVPEATFYFAIIIQILEYLHERDIVHRDLKPENMMVSESGYLKLIDFGAAKIVSGRTYTRLGTAWYMAPEVIKNKGYGPAADIWSAGIVFYELLSGRVPFGENEEDPYLVLKLVLERKLVLDGVPEECRGLLADLLQKIPEDRLSLHEIKRHKVFRNFDWEGLMAETLQPPRLPEREQWSETVKAALRTSDEMHNVLKVSHKQKSSGEFDASEFAMDLRRPPPLNWDVGF